MELLISSRGLVENFECSTLVIVEHTYIKYFVDFGDRLHHLPARSDLVFSIVRSGTYNNVDIVMSKNLSPSLYFYEFVSDDFRTKLGKMILYSNL